MSCIVQVNRECNQACLYCSSFYADAPNDKMIERQIMAEKDQIVLSGGEPLLRTDLPKLVKLASKQGVNEIELQSNGTLFFYPETAKKLVDAGVTIFNIALPSHIESICDRITRAKGFFGKRVQGIKNLLAAGANVRITLVICSLNKDGLSGYAKFVAKNFPGIKILEFNTVKIEGLARENQWLVPPLGSFDKGLASALKYCKSRGITALVDGVPLCHLQGFEKCSVDLLKIKKGRAERLHAAKEKGKKCGKCSIGKICLGVRKGYLALHGEGQLAPSGISPKEFLAKAK
ncbi:MAG: radical SAM protein [Candidatus Diapherotrites archaeon]